MPCRTRTSLTTPLGAGLRPVLTALVNAQPSGMSLPVPPRRSVESFRVLLFFRQGSSPSSWKRHPGRWCTLAFRNQELLAVEAVTKSLLLHKIHRVAKAGYHL